MFIILMIRGFNRKWVFDEGKIKKIKCRNCKKIVTWKTGYYGYNLVFCKKCYKEFDKQAEKAVDECFK